MTDTTISSLTATLLQVPWHGNPPENDLWVAPAIPKKGMLRPTEAPGHGVRFKPEILGSCRIGGREITKA